MYSLLQQRTLIIELYLDRISMFLLCFYLFILFTVYSTSMYHNPGRNQGWGTEAPPLARSKLRKKARIFNF